MKARIARLTLGVAGCIGWCSQALALPGELTLGGEAGLGRSTRTSWSPSLGLRGGYGIAEALDLQLEFSGQWMRAEQGVSFDTALLRLTPALVYKLDVVRWIPFARLGTGPVFGVPLEGEESTRIALALQGALGAEYLVDRSLSLGCAYQADWVLGSTDLSASLAPMHRLLVTVSWRSGW
jgi:hypothetical protein